MIHRKILRMLLGLSFRLHTSKLLLVVLEIPVEVNEKYLHLNSFWFLNHSHIALTFFISIHITWKILSYIKVNLDILIPRYSWVWYGLILLILPQEYSLKLLPEKLPYQNMFIYWQQTCRWSQIQFILPKEKLVNI